jgi:hypothetical protein
LRISVFLLRLRRWLPIFKGCVLSFARAFALRCPYSHHSIKALRDWPLHPSSRSDDLKGPLTEHPVSLYGAADVGEGHRWRLLWFNVTTASNSIHNTPFSLLSKPSTSFSCQPPPPPDSLCRCTLTPRCPTPAPQSRLSGPGHTLPATPSGLHSDCFPSFASYLLKTRQWSRHSSNLWRCLPCV